jgi:hypothetical protein
MLMLGQCLLGCVVAKAVQLVQKLGTPWTKNRKAQNRIEISRIKPSDQAVDTCRPSMLLSASCEKPSRTQ